MLVVLRTIQYNMTKMRVGGCFHLRLAFHLYGGIIGCFATTSFRYKLLRCISKSRFKSEWNGGHFFKGSGQT